MNSHDVSDFCREQFPQLVRMLGLYAGSVEVGEELAQETLVRVWRHWGKVRRLDNPSAWTHRVAINLANSYFRRRAAERRARSRLGPPEDVPPPSLEADAIRRAVARLPRRQKTVLILRYYLGLSFPEVAEWLAIPEGTAKSLAHRGLARLRRDEALNDVREVLNVT